MWNLPIAGFSTNSIELLTFFSNSYPIFARTPA
jgi:hypothetical protein